MTIRQNRANPPMQLHGKSIYLHFLDRELGESLRKEVSEHHAQIALKLLTLLTGSALNCSASILFESPAVNKSDSLNGLIQLLLEAGHISVLSSHPTMAEFFESRSILYSHDRHRYPMYFGRGVNVPDNVAIIPKSTSATSVLASEIGAWGADPKSGGDRERDAKNVVLDSLRRREDRAVTAALFSSAINASSHPEAAIGIIRRQISIEYTKHFMSSLNSDICTGIPEISYFDQCAIRYPLFDFSILLEISRAIGLRRCIESAWDDFRVFWEDYFYAGKSQEAIVQFQSSIEILGNSLRGMFDANAIQAKDTYRIWVLQVLRKIGATLDYIEIDPCKQDLSFLPSRMDNIIGLLKNSHEFSKHYEIAKSKQVVSMEFECLILVATDVERDAVLDKIRQIGNTPNVLFGGGRAYYDLGYIHGRRIALVKVAMGASTVGGSISTTMRMLDHLSPRYIIMIGIAFGVDVSKQKLGTVLVSRKVLGYEQQRVGTAEDDGSRSIRARGSITDASPELVSLFEATAGIWNEAPVEVGLMLSGEKLVDNVDFREDLKSIAGGEAIGGEMEGIGLVVAAAEKPTPWVIVKAICDWADGKKSEQKKERQLTAARNAVSFMFRALQIGPDYGGN